MENVWDFPDDIKVIIIPQMIEKIFNSIRELNQILSKYKFRLDTLSKKELDKYKKLIIHIRKGDMEFVSDEDAKNIKLLNRNQEKYDKVSPVILRNINRMKQNLKILSDLYHKITINNKRKLKK